MEDLPRWYEINIIFVTHYPDPKRWYKNQQGIEVTTPSSARFMRQREREEASSYITRDIKSSLML